MPLVSLLQSLVYTPFLPDTEPKLKFFRAAQSSLSHKYGFSAPAIIWCITKPLLISSINEKRVMISSLLQILSITKAMPLMGYIRKNKVKNHCIVSPVVYLQAHVGRVKCFLCLTEDKANTPRYKIWFALYYLSDE